MSDLLLVASGLILDLVFFGIIVLGTMWGAHRGFLVGISKLAGKIASILFAFFFCVGFANFLELCFHMTSAITSGIANAIANNEIYAAGIPSDVPGSELSAVLSEMGVSAIPRLFISWSFSDVELIPAGTSASILIASVLAKWISIVISFISLLILTRFGIRLIARGLKKLTDRFAPTRRVDRFLGALLGFLKAGFSIFVVLMICNWLPFAGIHNFINSSFVVSSIANSNWFHNMTSYAISGKWFSKFLSNQS